MSSVVIYGVGSPFIVDVVESLRRAGVNILAAIQNVGGNSFFVNTDAPVYQNVSDQFRECLFITPLFSPHNRQTASREAKSNGLGKALVLIDPTSVIPSAINFGEGLYINAGVSIGGASEFGPFTFINRGANIGHHFRCAEFVSIGPGVVVAGGVSVGKGAFLGAGSVILPNIKIGTNSVIAAGAVVTQDVPSNTLVVGSPARIVKEIEGYDNKGVM